MSIIVTARDNRPAVRLAASMEGSGINHGVTVEMTPSEARELSRELMRAAAAASLILHEFKDDNASGQQLGASRCAVCSLPPVSSNHHTRRNA